MTALQGTIKNGQIVLDAPAVLPEGTRVEVLSIEAVRATSGVLDTWAAVDEIYLRLANSGQTYSDSADLLREDRDR